MLDFRNIIMRCEFYQKFRALSRYMPIFFGMPWKNWVSNAPRRFCRNFLSASRSLRAVGSVFGDTLVGPMILRLEKEFRRFNDHCGVRGHW
jgi:hypothetical protein